jgi:hypothetical protein
MNEGRSLLIVSIPARTVLAGNPDKLVEEP